MANKPDQTKRLVLYAIWLVILLGLAYEFMNPGECPEHYTQAQIDETGCTVGANIGLGIILLFIWPVLVVVLALLLLSIYRYFRKPRKSGKSE